MSFKWKSADGRKEFTIPYLTVCLLILSLLAGYFVGSRNPSGQTITRTSTSTYTSGGTFSVAISTQTVVSFQTVTSISTLTTFSIPPTYEVKGSISTGQGITSRYLIFKSGGVVKGNFSVSADTYIGSLSNSLPYTVFLQYQFEGIGSILTNSGCGAFNDTVAWGSSPLVMNWNC